MKAKHLPCACGCGELADECMSPRSNPLAAFRIEPPVGSAPAVARCRFCGAETDQHDPTALLCDRCNLAQVAVVRARLDHVSGTGWTGGPL